MNKSVWIEKLPQGYSVRRRGSPREWFNTYQDAQKRKAELKLKLLAEKQGSINPTLRLADTFYSYLDWCERNGYSPETLSFKRDHMARFLGFKVYLSEITEETLQAFYVILTTIDISPTTVKMELTEIRAFLNWCVKQKMIATTPFKLEIRAIKTPRRKLPLSDIKMLEKHLDKRFKPYYYLMADHGTRRGETLKARFEDFDLEQGVWTIPAQTTKGKRERIIPLSDRAVKSIVSLGITNGPIFPGWAKTTPRFYLSRAKKRAEVETGRDFGRIFPHLFRHTRASNWRGNTYAMMEYMGWRSMAMAKLYSHHDIEDLRRESQK